MNKVILIMTLFCNVISFYTAPITNSKISINDLDNILSYNRKENIYLLRVTAKWCPVCKYSSKEISKISKKYKDDNVFIYELDYDENRNFYLSNVIIPKSRLAIQWITMLLALTIFVLLLSTRLQIVI